MLRPSATPSGTPNTSPITASTLAWVATTIRVCSRVIPSARRTASSWRRRFTAMDRACPTAPRASRARKAPSARGSNSRSLITWTSGSAGGEPDRGAGDGVQLAGGRRGQRYLVPRDGHAPGGEDDRYPFAGYRGIGEALDGDLAGLRTADTGVIDAGHVTVGGDGTQHPAGRPEVLPVETQERAQLPGLPEARRVGGGVGHPGGEGEGGEHTEDAHNRAYQSRADRHRGAAAPGLKRKASAHHDRQRKSRSRRRHRHRGP